MKLSAGFPKQHRAWQTPEVHKVFAQQMNELNEVQIRNNLFFLLLSALTTSTQNTGSMRKEPGIWNGVPLNIIFGRQESQGGLSCNGARVRGITFVIHLAAEFQDSLVSKCRCASAMPLPFSTVILSLSPIPISPHGCLWKSQGETILENALIKWW